MAKVTNSIERKVIDENGEITYSEEQRTVNFGKEPNYVKLYIDNLLFISDLPQGLSATLMAFLKRMSYGNQLVLNAALKRQIAKELGKSVSTVNNAISKFVKGQILIREDTGLYLINPHLFGKGEWKDIAKIRLNIVFDENGKTVMTEIKRKQDQEEAPKEQIEPSEEIDIDKMQTMYEEFEENKDDLIEDNQEFNEYEYGESSIPEDTPPWEED